MTISPFPLYWGELKILLVKNNHPLYQKFQDLLLNQDLREIDLFSTPSFIAQLTDDEKFKLGFLFQKRAENLLKKNEGEELCHALGVAQKLTNSHPEVLFHSASQLYKFGFFNQQKRYLYLALDKIQELEKKSPHYFEGYFWGFHLWGNILVALNEHLNDESLLENAIEKYEKAVTLLQKESGLNPALVAVVYWDLADAFSKLSKRSLEPYDLMKALKNYSKAYELGCRYPHLFIDYAEALIDLGLAQGTTEHLKEASELLKKAIVDIETSEERPKRALDRSWTLYVLASLHIVELTSNGEELKKTLTLFHQALLEIDNTSELRVKFCQFLIRFGWKKKELELIELAIDNLTNSNLDLSFSVAKLALLGEALTALGLLLDDFYLLKEGEKRIHQALGFEKKGNRLAYAKAFIRFAYGAYFADGKYYVESLRIISKSRNINSIEMKELLYEIYLALAEVKNDKSYLHKAIQLLDHLIKRRPENYHLLNEWGMALLKLRKYKSSDFALEEAVEKFKMALAKKGGCDDPLLLYHYGISLDILGEMMQDKTCYEKAVRAFTEALTKMPRSLNIKYHLALTLSHYGEWEGESEKLREAMKLFEEVLQIDKEDGYAWGYLGYCRIVLSELLVDPLFKEEEMALKEKAESELKYACQLGNEECYYHLAALYALKNKLKEAIFFLYKAMEAGVLPSHDELLEDNWLVNLRETEEFNKFLTMLK